MDSEPEIEMLAVAPGGAAEEPLIEESVWGAVQALREQGLSKREIGRELDLDIKTVRKWLRQKWAPQRRPGRSRATRSFRAAARGWSRPDRAFAESLAAGLLACTGEALELILPPPLVAPPHASPDADREAATELWPGLERRTPGERRAIIEEHSAYCTWAMCEFVSAKSVEAALPARCQSMLLRDLLDVVSCPPLVLPSPRLPIF